MNQNVIFNKNTSYALKEQKMWNDDDYEFPFSCNPSNGCLFKCKYCYLQQPFYSRKLQFGDVAVKNQIIVALEKDLRKYSNLPQYLKRVQLGNSSEVFCPVVLKKMKSEIGVTGLI